MSLDEFLDFMTRQLSVAPERREEDLSKEFKALLRETFRWYDKDADGIISWNELKVGFYSLSLEACLRVCSYFFNTC